MDSTVEQPAAEREPDNVTPERRTQLAWPYEVPPPSGFDPGPAECQASCCAGRTIPWPAELDPHLVAPVEPVRVIEAQGLRDLEVATRDGQPITAAPGVEVEPEPRRSVSLERLTPELLAEEEQRRRVEAREQGVSFEPIPANATVAVVARVNGLLGGVWDTDADWMCTRADLLVAMLRSASDLAADGEAELLMPTPDVLAALSGSTAGGYWTAEITMRADQLERGWLIANYAKEGADALIAAVDDQCEDTTCPWHGTCIAITAGGLEPLHVSTWSTFEVRIPCAAVNHG